MMDQRFELKLSNGKIVDWMGTSGENAAHRYVDSHRDRTVVAWRYPKVELRFGMIRIKED